MWSKLNMVKKGTRSDTVELHECGEGFEIGKVIDKFLDFCRN